MATRNGQPPPLELSALAEKYSHPVGDEHDALYGSSELKSGLTPLDQGPFNKAEDHDNFQRWREYQQKRFGEFTANELKTMEALAPMFERGTDPNLDGVPIHPLVARERWRTRLGKHLAIYPIRRGNDGFWHAANDEIWNAIVPALKLVSLFLTNAHVSPWLDGLLFGPREPIPRSEIPNRGEFASQQYQRFRARRLSVVQSQEERNKVQDKLLSVAKNVEWSFMSGYNQPLNGLPNSMVYLGVTQPQPMWYEKTSIIIAIEMVESLIRMDLTTAERAIETFRLASVMCHEIAHTLWLELEPDRRTRHKYICEPFFEDEVMCELGFSFQNALFGGIPKEFVPMEKPASEFGLPAGGIFRLGLNEVASAGYYPDLPTLLSVPQGFHTRERWPVPMGFFLDLGQEPFWETHVRSFGAAGTNMGPLIKGSQFTYPPDENERGSQISNTHPHPEPVMIDYELSKEDKVALDFENQRRIRAKRIQDQLKTYTDEAGSIRFAQYELIQSGQLSGEVAPRPPTLPVETASCARYPEIRAFLFANRLELALDTLNFRMPEHMMYAHILRTGKINLTTEEWRSFLEVCHFRKVLFKHTKIGTGFLERLGSGWPVSPLAPRPSWPKPDDILINHFLAVSGAVVKTAQVVFYDDYCDHDKSHFRNICISHGANFTPEGQRISDFEPALFEALLYWCHMEKCMFTYGPPGTIRLLRDSPLVNLIGPVGPIPPPSPPEKKKKRRHGERCAQM